MLRVCKKGHLTGFRNCPMCGENAKNAPPPRPRKALIPHASEISRTQMRRVEFLDAMYAVNRRNLREIGRSHFVGMSRRERRQLAKAYAAGARRRAREAKAAA